MCKKICVFCSSSDKVDSIYFNEAEELGRLMAVKGYHLVYGGAEVGLMGALARSVHAYKGKVIGVIPDKLKDKEVAYEGADELIVTDDMRVRKTIMEQRSDAFIVLPGGYGTLEEIFEILTLKLLRYHNKPVVIVNTNGFYEHLIKLLDHIIAEQFAKPSSLQHFKIVPDVNKAVEAIDKLLVD